jgi:hypothetical protein
MHERGVLEFRSEKPRRLAWRIVFESSSTRTQTLRSVANWTANWPARYIWRRLATRQPDLGSGTARCGGSSPSSCTGNPAGVSVHSAGLG